MTIVQNKTLPPRVAEAIRQYLWSRTQQERPVSVAKILRAVVYAFPDTGFSDDKLSDLIVQELVLEGCDVDFDREKPEPVMRPVAERAREGESIERSS